MPTYDLAGRTALVTGGASGIRARDRRTAGVLRRDGRHQFPAG